MPELTLEKMFDDVFSMGKYHPEDYKVLKAGVLKKAELLIDKRILDAEIEVLESILDFQPAVEGRFRRTIEDRLFRLTALSDKHSSKEDV